MYGHSRIAAIRNPSASDASAWSSSPARAGSFASTQGVRSSTSWLRRRTSRQASSAAPVMSTRSNAAVTAPTRSPTSAASAASPPASAGTTPSR